MSIYTEGEGPYILCPHSMSGIESLYWAQKYPQEVKAIVDLDMSVPVPILMFLSNGQGTGWSKEQWKEFQKEFALENEKRKIIELDCTHYVHDYEYDRISDEIRKFMN